MTRTQLMHRLTPVVSLLLCVNTAPAQDVLTMQAVFSLAKVRTRSVLAADTAVKSERASMAGATPLFGQNPSIEGGAGLVVQPATPRLGPTPLVSPFPSAWQDTRLGPAGWVQVVVPVEVAGQRWRRVAAVDARVASRTASMEDRQRLALLEAGSAFLRALHAARTASLAVDSLTLAEALHAAAQQRLDAGAGSGMELRIAGLEVDSARQVKTAADARAQVARSELAALLGLTPEELKPLEGNLVPDQPLVALETALVTAEQRADVRALKAERRAALAEASVASAGLFPTPRLKGSYQYWNSEQSAMAWVEVPIPVFERGQGEEARARARAGGLAGETDAALQSARAEIRGLHAAAQAMQHARAQPHANGRALLTELQTHFSERRFDIGALLAVRRQVLQSEAAVLDAALQEGLIRLWLDAATGVIGRP